MPTDFVVAVCCTYIYVARMWCCLNWRCITATKPLDCKIKITNKRQLKGEQIRIYCIKLNTKYNKSILSMGTFCANLGWRQDRALTRKSRIHGEMSGDITWEFHGVLILITHWDSAALSSYLDSKLRDDNQCRFYLITAWGCEQSSILKIIGKWVLTVASQK